VAGIFTQVQPTVSQKGQSYGRATIIPLLRVVLWVRLVQLSVPVGKRDVVCETLEESNIPYMMTDEVSGRDHEAVVSMALPAAMVESTIDTLHSKGIGDEAYTVVVEAETVLAEDFEALQDESDEESVETERISRQELQSEATSLTPSFDVYATMTVVSAIVATAGLLLDSPAVVVGSMVIAPLIGPALGASVGSVINDRELLIKSVKYQLIGVGLAICAAAVFATLVRMGNIVPPGIAISGIDEIEERLAPDLLSLAVALGAGVAGIVSISTGISVALVGVMIAAALIPPAAAVGIAIAWGDPFAAIGSTVLVFVNVLSVNLAGLLTLWYAGYRPERLFDRDQAEKRVRKQVLGLVVLVLVFSTVLGGITYADFTTATFEQDANDEAQALLEQEEYAAYQLLDLEVELDADFPFRGPERVVVTIGGPPDAPPVALAADLEERIGVQTEYAVDIEVRYVEVISHEVTTESQTGSSSVESPNSTETRHSSSTAVSPLLETPVPSSLDPGSGPGAHASPIRG